MLTCQVGGKTHIHAKYAGWFGAHCCVFALFAAQAPGLSVMATEPSCGEQTGSWYLVKSRSCWKWDCPLFALLPALLLSHLPHTWGDACTMAVQAFISTVLCIWQPFCPHLLGCDAVTVCSMQSWTCLHWEISFLATGHHAGNTPLLLPHAPSSTSTPSALSHRAQRLYGQARNLGPAFPNFRGDLVVATSQLII